MESVNSGGTKRAPSVKVPLLRLQSSEGKLTMSREIEPDAGPSAGTEVARKRKWHAWCLLVNVYAWVKSRQGGCDQMLTLD